MHQRILSMNGAKSLVQKFHASNPDTKILVWMGALGTPLGGEVDIGNESVILADGG